MLASAAGRTDPARGLAEFDTLLAEAGGGDRAADVLLQKYRLSKDEATREEARQVYLALQSRVPKLVYRHALEELESKPLNASLR